MERPKLIEPGVKYFLAQTLKECRKFKDTYLTVIFNISMFIILITIIGGFLYFKYKGKLKPHEIKEKNKQKQEYIVSKLQQIALVKQKQHSNLITDLPLWNNK